MATPASCGAAPPVVVWHAEVDPFARDPLAIAGWRDRLSPADRARHDRFRRESDRGMFLLGRAMARVLVGDALGCDPQAWPWREGARGRPEIDDPAASVRFNLAHSAGLVVCAIARGRDVGVDVEDLARRPPHPDMVERYCSPEEVRDIRARGGDWQGRFLTYWTLKEAYLKARGLGIAVQLSEMTFTIHDDRAAIGFTGRLAGTDSQWTFRLSRPTARHILAIAAANLDAADPDVIVQPLPAARLRLR
jgi:4'-phosphopantetheinyl transferase